MDTLSMSLDDIIKRNKNFRGNLRGRGRRSNNVVNNNFQNKSTVRGRIRKRFSGPQNRFPSYKIRGDVDSPWKHDLYDGEENEIMEEDVDDYIPDNNAKKLMISNLEFGVSDYDLAELFGEFGPLLAAEVHYDRSGRSLGTAEVTFKNKASAVDAMNFYNGVPLDGRPMNIRFFSESVESVPFRQTRGRGRQIPPMNRRRRGGGFQRNEVRGRGAGNRNRTNRNNTDNLTAEQLDAELDSYVNAN